MQPKVEFNKIRNMGQVLDASLQFIKQNWPPLLKAYITICGIFWLTGFAVSTINQIRTFQLVQQGETIFSGLYFLTIGIEFVNHILIMITSVSFVVLYREKDNQPPAVDEVWGYVKYYFFRVMGSYILLLILTLVGLVCCIIPGIYFMPVTSLIMTIMIVENGSLQHSFNRAFKLIKDRWWHIFGVLILSVVFVAITMVMILIPAMIICFIAVFFTGAHDNNTYLVALGVSTHLVQVLYILPYIAIATAYYSLTEQKEDHHLLNRIAMLGTTAPATGDAPTDEEY